MSAALEKELATYNAKLPELFADTGKFVLIKEDKLEGVFDTYGDALKVGYERFKLEPFLVRQIGVDERALFFARDVVCVCH